MKNLILDHCRRWCWVFALGGGYAFILGWSLATPEFSGGYWHGKHSFIESFFKIQSSMLVMQSACLATFTGAILLFYDLQRGLVRAVAVLPMTGGNWAGVGGWRRWPFQRPCRLRCCPLARRYSISFTRAQHFLCPGCSWRTCSFCSGRARHLSLTSPTMPRRGFRGESYIILLPARRSSG